MFLIFQHELANAVRTAWFIGMTLAVPVVAFLGIEIYSLVNRPTAPLPAVQDGAESLIVPLALAILLIFSLALSQTAMLYTLGDEKENRILEILVSSVSARQLLAGKVLAVVVAGLIQIVVWLISIPFVVRAGSSAIGGFFASIQAPIGLLILAGVYFVLAYLLFAVIMACTGVIAPNAREGGQLASVFVLFMVAPIWFASLIYLYPDSLVSTALSIFPLSSAVVMLIRSGVTDVPAWQVAFSLALLIASCVGGLLLAAKLFQIYLLSYSRTPKLAEMIKALRR